MCCKCVVLTRTLWQSLPFTTKSHLYTKNPLLFIICIYSCIYLAFLGVTVPVHMGNRMLTAKPASPAFTLQVDAD